MEIRKAITAALLSVSLLGAGGCALLAGAAAGVATYIYIEGESQAVYPFSFDRMWNESRAMLARQDVTVTAASNTESEGTLEGTFPDGEEVKVDVVSQGESSTRVDIRVGVIPNEDAANNLQRSLAQRVGVALSQ